jgi:hypothetical protein
VDNFDGMFSFPQKSKLSQTTVFKNGTQTRYWAARPFGAFHFFVFVLIISFLMLTIAPFRGMAESAATSSDEGVGDQTESVIIEESNSDLPADEEIANPQSPLFFDGSTTTEDISINDEGLTINDDSSATTTESASTTDEILVNDEQLTINDSARILAQWQMVENGIDDDPAPLAQFEPSGEFGVGKDFNFCVAADSSGGEIAGIYGQIFYPKTAAFGPTDPAGRRGCGQESGPLLNLEKLTPELAFDLFCEKIQKNNYNLPVFAAGLGYVDLCAADGLLIKQSANVYCAQTRLAFDDLAGDYQTLVLAKTVSGNYSEESISKFTYMPKSAIDIDFNDLEYGAVKENVETVVNGDEVWSEENLTQATVRNSGNTRLMIKVWQDDMGVGQTNGTYNIRYKARVGQGNPWQEYAPFATTTLANILDLSSDQPLDFSVTVAKFLDDDLSRYLGKMDLDIVSVPDYSCAADLSPQSTPETLGLPVAQNNESATTTNEIQSDDNLNIKVESDSGIENTTSTDPVI